MEGKEMIFIGALLPGGNDYPAKEAKVFLSRSEILMRRKGYRSNHRLFRLRSASATS
jgi:hypothetical protein